MSRARATADWSGASSARAYAGRAKKACTAPAIQAMRNIPPPSVETELSSSPAIASTTPPQLRIP
jgi:hypothetical protein